MNREQVRSLRLIVTDRVSKRVVAIRKANEERYAKLEAERNKMVEQVFSAAVANGKVRTLGPKHRSYGQPALCNDDKSIQDLVIYHLSKTELEWFKLNHSELEKLIVRYPNVKELIDLVLAEAELMETDKALDSVEKFIVEVMTSCITTRG
ncbi:hypothetical protein [Candidatus Magnetobacterium casense]|uniref:DNA-directed RNA polymerase III subunit RPC9 n=1 Tax=Candidatus Magnetobacterium casense TaxID=1455061 RepID=A0ABS6S4N2_9BACT|nr:hypothetical protein [Candidatus Magnetobacterium casensis]MBV6343570.1 hypothetical protein [Candidatus Magnetobacterium casensis]